MAEYIEREAAIRVVNGHSSLTMTRSSLIDSIGKLPATDVAPVTRCKDCAHKERATVNEKGFLICPASGMDITPDDFCSLGEPKEGNHA